MEYSGDLKACLFQWTAPEKLSADWLGYITFYCTVVDCATLPTVIVKFFLTHFLNLSLALAPKVEKKERKLSQSEKKKADARRK